MVIRTISLANPAIKQWTFPLQMRGRQQVTRHAVALVRFHTRRCGRDPRVPGLQKFLTGPARPPDCPWVNDSHWRIELMRLARDPAPLSVHFRPKCVSIAKIQADADRPTNPDEK